MLIPKLQLAKLRRFPFIQGPLGRRLVPHNQGITVPTPLLSSLFSFELWFRSTSSSSQRLLETNEFKLTVSAGVLSMTANGVTVSGGSGLADSLWHYVVVTYDGANLRLYLDGTLVGGPSAVSLNLTATFAYVGTDWLGTSTVVGQLADLAIYLTVLNTSQIANHYTLRTSMGVLTSLMTVRDREFSPLLGTVTGGVAFSQAGPLGDVATVATFDGTTGYVDAGDQTSFDFDKQFSVEVWFKSTTSGLLPLVTKTVAAGNGWGLFLNSGAIRSWAYTAAAASIFDVSVGSGYNDGQWHHVVVTWDFTTTAGHVRVYVDGAQVGTGTASSTAQQGSAGHTLRLGYRADNAGNFFTGSLANAALYWYELTAAQIAAHYAARLLINDTFTQLAYSVTVLADTPVGYWRLGEAVGVTTVVDSSGNGNPGAITGGVTLGQAGALGDGNTAALFNGSTGQVNVPYAAVLAPTSAISLEAWIRPTGASGAGTIVNKFGSAGSWWYLRQFNASLQISFHGDDDLHTYTPSTWPTGVWTHVVATYDGTTARMYMNGVQVDSWASTFGISVNTGPVCFGSFGGTQQPFAGALDEEAVYNYALSATQVAAHYAARLSVLVYSATQSSYRATILADAPVGYWRLDAPSGTTENDISGGGWTATISGGVTLNQAGAIDDGDTAELFDGATGTYIQTNSNFTYPFGTGPMSLEYWFKFTSALTQIGVVDDKNAGSNDAGFNTAFFAGAPFFRIGNGTSQASISSSHTFNDGNWHHCVCVLTRGAPDTLKIYIDGVLDTSGNLGVSGWNITSSQVLRIGGYSTGGSPNFFIGTLDEVAVYAVALTPSQILAHYNAAFAPHVESRTGVARVGFSQVG